MENKIQNTILIGDEDENNQNKNNNDDIFETIYNEIKENFKSVDEEGLKNEDLKEEKEKAEEKENQDNEIKTITEDINGFVLVEKPEEKQEDTKRKKSDENDF